MEFITYGPNAAEEGLEEANAYNAKNNALTNPAAYGSIPGAVSPTSTSGPATAAAITAGQTVNQQLPGYNQSLANVGQNIQADTAGQLPTDVIQQLQEQSAESGATTGAGSNAAYLKALGLTSLGLEQTGQQDLQSILTSLPGAAISQNPAFQATTGEQLAAGQQNSVWGAAPQPAAAAAASLAATGAGYGVGSSSGSPGGLWASTSQPYSPPTSTNVSPWNSSATGTDTGNAPGSAGAYANWNAWNGQAVYPASTTGTGDASNPYLAGAETAGYDPSAAPIDQSQEEADYYSDWSNN